MPQAQRILITGSRNWGNWTATEKVIRALPVGAEVAHGDARGADTMFHWLLTKGRTKDVRRAKRVWVHSQHSTEIGQRQGGRGDVEIHVFPAEWDRHAPPEGSDRKNPAGPIRNQYMLDYFNPDLVVYFHDDLVIGEGGTGHMVKIALDSGLEVFDWQDYVALRRGE